VVAGERSAMPSDRAAGSGQGTAPTKEKDWRLNAGQGRTLLWPAQMGTDGLEQVQCPFL